MSDRPPAERPTPVDVQTRFERFPATIKGAFVLRGVDGDPHTVQVEETRVVRVPSGPGRDIPVGDLQVDVSPTKDLFVPFEAGVGDLEAGWYAVRTVARVDTVGTFEYWSRAFCIPWPRASVRRGSTRLGELVTAGAEELRIERVELLQDAAVTVWRAGVEPQPPGGASERGVASSVDVLLLADGRPLEVVPEHLAPLPRVAAGPGERRSVSYPVMRSVSSLVVAVRVAGGEPSEAVRVPLD